MRCHICNKVLENIIPDVGFKGGYRPCTECLKHIFDTAIEVHLDTEEIDPVQSDIDSLTDVELVD